MGVNSSRTYLCLWSEAGEIHRKEISVSRIFNNSKNSEFEYIYAVQDRCDEILDLKLNESMYFQFNRDDEDSKGIIKRIS